ncbi:MAG TPA: glucose 1-dehydrogenase [Firmicutes bacterium]|nr:glucose 1-dehydrogenase [Bacillota bacterium]
MDRLKDKIAIITGAAGGIGRVAAELFVKEGAKVVLADKDSENGAKAAKEICALSPNSAIFFPLDVTDKQSWGQCIEQTLNTFGKLNILINNAGVSFRETVEETTMESWQTTLAVNQTGVFLGIQSALEVMKTNGEPCAIVNTASVDGLRGDSVFFAYCATKAAVEAMTKCAALCCAENSWPIRVNAVAPGYILTPMAYEDARQNGQTIEEYCAESVKLHPIGHLGKPEDIAYAYLYLASDEASFVTGTTLAVDGGYTCR